MKWLADHHPNVHQFVASVVHMSINSFNDPDTAEQYVEVLERQWPDNAELMTKVSICDKSVLI